MIIKSKQSLSEVQCSKFSCKCSVVFGFYTSYKEFGYKNGVNILKFSWFNKLSSCHFDWI